MPRRLDDYHIIYESTIESLERAVKEFMHSHEGYQFVGGVNTLSGGFYQTVARFCN